MALVSHYRRWKLAAHHLSAAVSALRGKRQSLPVEETLSALDYATLLAERKILLDIEGEQAKSFDQAMLTLSAGALALSLTFIHDIVPNPDHLGWLYASWIVFGAAVASTVTSFLLSQFASRRALINLERKYKDSAAPEGRNPAARGVACLNLMAIATFITGMSILIAFCIWNLDEGGIRVITATPSPATSP